MSSHAIEVITIPKVKKHPNADTLGLVDIWGWSCCIRLNDFKEGDLAVYIPPDYMVPDIEAFQFLKDSSSDRWRRIRVRRFRGILSQGLVWFAPEGTKEGDDVMELMGITRYEPPLPTSFNTDNETGPHGYYPKYDVENYRRYGSGIFVEGEEIVVTEKIHGCNARFVCTLPKSDKTWPDGTPIGPCDAAFPNESETLRMFCGSRTNWKKKDEKSPWWQTLQQNPAIETWCRAHPGLVLYAEVYGQVQSLKYGANRNQFFVAVFDILDLDGNWLEFDEAFTLVSEVPGLNWAPVVYRGLCNEEVLELAEGDSLIPGANHLREGVVVQPIKERRDNMCGRVKLKIVSNQYLEGKKSHRGA